MTDLLKHQMIDGEIMAYGDHMPNWSLPGTGKTLTTLQAFKVAGHGVGVVLAPPIALDMWAEQIEKFLHVPACILRSGKSPIVGEPGVLVTTYALAAGSQKERIASFSQAYGGNGAALILDEAHALKTRTSKRTQAIFGSACTGRRGLFDLFDQCWSLTGTPIIRWPDDLWAQLRATKPNVLREYGVLEYEKFVNVFCRCDVKQYNPRMRPQKVVVGAQNIEMLQELIADVGAPRRKLSEVTDMPPLSIRTLTVESVDIRRLNSALKDVSVSEIVEGLQKQDDNMITHWRKMGLAKVEPALDYIIDSAAVGPVLVGHWFTETGNTIAKTLSTKGLKVVQVNGATPSKARETIRVAFNNGHIDVLVGQISAMNVSWNLQEAGRHVIMLEDHWSPGIVEQFYKRVYRMGQKDHVQLDFIKAAGNPIDRALTEVRNRKDDTVDRLFKD